MQQNLEQKQPYYREYGVTKSGLVNLTHLACPVTAKIIVIISPANASAALDFIDELKMINLNLVLLGEETASDRLYMDIRKVELPSDHGTFAFPLKVYRNRHRGDKQTYKPDVACDTSNTQKLEKVIFKIIEN